jgi:hypothetical protein
MEQCPICDESLREALVVCRYCGEVLPLRVVVFSEGSHGDGGFAVVVKDPRRRDGRALNDEDEEVVDAS